MPTEPPRIPWDALKLEELKGNGSFGDVYRGQWTGKEVAIKVLQLKTLPQQLEQDFANEVKIMLDCKFPNILALYGVCAELGHYAMVMEYMPRGSLYQLLHSDQEIPEELRWQIATDIAQGLAYLHGKGVLHRDLKSSNILLDEHFHAKIADFGLAKLKLESSSTTTSRRHIGTIRWRAPELFKRKATATLATDVYSYGMVLWEITSRQIPFSDAQDEITAMGWIKDGEQEQIPEHCPKVWQEIIKECWQLPEQRPNAAKIVCLLEQHKPKKSIATKSWHFDGKPFRDKIKGYKLFPASPLDFQKVLKCYEHHSVPGYDLRAVEVIYNPKMNRSFHLRMDALQARENNPAYAAKWPHEGDLQECSWRKEIYDLWQKLAAPHVDQDFPAVKLLPLWHGTKPELLSSIFETGYANLATTDSGFFGKGIYSAHEAEYAYRVYSQGALILNWVATFSAYPVIKGDSINLVGKANYQNYDAHFVPVVPNDPDNPNEVSYYPCAPEEQYKYIEVVVFEQPLCLPRYLVTLQPVLPKTPSSLSTALLQLSLNPVNITDLNPTLSTISASKAVTPSQLLVQSKFENDYYWYDVGGKGNCLFLSIAHQLKIRKIEEVDHIIVRSKIADYINEHWDEYKKFITDQDLKRAKIGHLKCADTLSVHEKLKYIDKLKEDGYWGDHLSIKAAVLVFKINIVVKSLLGTAYEVNEVIINARDTIYIGHIAELHYQSLFLPHEITQIADTENAIQASLVASSSNDIAPPLVMFSNQAQGIDELSTSINLKEIEQFLEHITFGRQDEAEIMLQNNKQLAVTPANVIDCAKRRFTQITGFQYALWALDWHMWTMLQKYIPKGLQQQQLQAMAQGSWVKDHGDHVTWRSLIDALKNYRAGYNLLKVGAWYRTVGGAQLSLPAHVIQEYQRSDRSFEPCPLFDELILPRTDLKPWYGVDVTLANSKVLHYKLGVNLAWVRKNDLTLLHYRSLDPGMPDLPPNPKDVKMDLLALTALLDLRINQRKEFIDQMELTIKATPKAVIN